MGTRRMLSAGGLDGPTDEQEARVESATPTRSLTGMIFGVTTRWQTYARLLYLLLSFPLGVAVFVSLLTLLIVGGALSFTLIGLPLLVLTMFGWCYAAELHRLLANTLLRTGIHPLPFENERGRVWQWSRIGPRIRNQYTWRAFVFGFLSFGLGMAAISIAWSTLGQAFALMHMPITYWLGEGPEIGPGWNIDTMREALLCSVLGVLWIVPSLHIINLAGWAAGKVVAFFLQSEGHSDASASTTTFDRAVVSAVAWPGWNSAQHDAGASRPRSIQLRVWQVSLALYVVVITGLVFINGLTTPGQWWVLWPAWAWGIVLATHTGYFLRGHLGAHVAAYLVTIVGLFVIDSMYSGRSWFFWPMIGWGIAVAAHAYVYLGFSKVRPEEALILLDGEPQAFTPTFELQPEPAPIVPIAVDVALRNVRVDGSPIEVTPKEFDLLALLTANPGRPFTREELLDSIWKNDFEVTDRTIDTHVQRLRRKLGLRSEAIQTVWGVGYRYQP